MNLFDQFFKDFFYSGEFDGVKRKTKDGKLMYSVDVPGFNESNLNVEYNKGYVIIKGKTEDRELNKMIYVDRRGDPEKASVKDGVLTLQFQVDKSLEGKKIAIEQG